MTQRSPSTPPTRWSREDLRAIAAHQKIILLCILVHLLALVAQFLLSPDGRLVLSIGVVAVGIVAAIFIFKLALRIYSTGQGVMLAILTLIPVIGLVSLLVVNTKATRTLRENGIPVGLLGARGPIE
jgi:hypothetical protein